MRLSDIAALAVAGVVILAPATAGAHFVLQAPANWAEQDIQGQPQKTAPCGQADPEVTAVPTNAVTSFTAGQTITVTIDETTFHPGHYRVLLSTTGPAGLPADPIATEPGTCVGLAIQDPPVLPVLADGMLQHTDPFVGPQSFPVKLPDGVTCTNCTLQVLEFMQADVGGNGFCYYHHCANVSIATATTDAGGDGGGGGEGGGCACAVTSDRASFAPLLVLLAIAGLRRRHVPFEPVPRIRSQQIGIEAAHHRAVMSSKNYASSSSPRTETVSPASLRISSMASRSVSSDNSLSAAARMSAAS